MRSQPTVSFSSLIFPLGVSLGRREVVPRDDSIYILINRRVMIGGVGGPAICPQSADYSGISSFNYIIDLENRTLIFLPVKMEATGGIEPPNKGFADPRLTTWLRGQIN
jgi:hypothetical protein